MNQTSIEAMNGVVFSSLHALEIALQDMKDHPKVALRRGIDEAETLSGATVRLMKLIDAAPQPKGVERQDHSTGPTVNIEDVRLVLDTFQNADTNGICGECGGVID